MACQREQPWQVGEARLMSTRLSACRPSTQDRRIVCNVLHNGAIRKLRQPPIPGLKGELPKIPFAVSFANTWNLATFRRKNEG